MIVNDMICFTSPISLIQELNYFLVNNSISYVTGLPQQPIHRALSISFFVLFDLVLLSWQVICILENLHFLEPGHPDQSNARTIDFRVHFSMISYNHNIARKVPKPYQIRHHTWKTYLLFHLEVFTTFLLHLLL
jgi:hypothetical protein